MDISFNKYSTGDHKQILKKKTILSYTCQCTINSKGKAIPLEAWTGPEGSRRLRLPDF
jgi:hypothetical protein